MHNLFTKLSTALSHLRSSAFICGLLLSVFVPSVPSQELPPLPEPQTELITNTVIVPRTNIIQVTVSTVTEVPRLHYYAIYKDGHFSHVGRFGQEQKWRQAYPHVINDPQLLAIISTPRPLHDPKTVCLP